MQFNRFTHLNDTHAVQNSGILQFSKIRPQSLCNVLIPWSIKYMWFNAAHSLLILTSPNCSLIRGHFPVWCGGRCTAPGGVRMVSGRLRTVPDGSGRLLVGPSAAAVPPTENMQRHLPSPASCLTHAYSSSMLDCTRNIKHLNKDIQHKITMQL